MKNNSLVIWKSLPIIIEVKMPHIRKIGGRLYSGFCRDYGDVPVVVINSITKQPMEVVNTRGNGYAHRNHQKFRKNKNK